MYVHIARIINRNSVNTAPNAPKMPGAQLVCANSMLSFVIVIGTEVLRAGSPVMNGNGHYSREPVIMYK